MIPPLLKLAFVQGPRDGETLEYKPGSTIRIGRVVRGNEIAIKDAGVSTKHIRIVSDSENWIIHDLGSSNGTILNSETLDPDTPVNLRHGDVIKLGEYTSMVVNFETDVEAQEHKLPPRPRRNNRRLLVADPDPVPVPIESVQEKPPRKGRSAKQAEHEPPKRGRATRSKKLEDIVDNEKKSDVENDEEVNSRVTRSSKKEAITKEEEVPVEKKGNSRARGGKKNTEAAQDLGLNPIKVEIEDTPMGVEISAAKKRATRSRQVGNECSGLEENVEEKRPLRATRSKKKEIGGDSFLELEMVLNQARRSRAKKKKMESKSVVEEVEARKDEVEEDEENEKDVEAQEGRSEKEDETSKREEQVEVETLGEDDLNSSVREDGETENLQDTMGEEGDCKSEAAGIETSEKSEQESGSKEKKVDLEKMTLGEWFKFMEVYLPKQIVEETEKMIEPMRSKALRVHKYIAEQKQAKGKGSVS